MDPYAHIFTPSKYPSSNSVFSDRALENSLYGMGPTMTSASEAKGMQRSPSGLSAASSTSQSKLVANPLYETSMDDAAAANALYADVRYDFAPGVAAANSESFYQEHSGNDSYIQVTDTAVSQDPNYKSPVK